MRSCKYSFPNDKSKITLKVPISSLLLLQPYTEKVVLIGERKKLILPYRFLKVVVALKLLFLY